MSYPYPSWRGIPIVTEPAVPAAETTIFAINVADPDAHVGVLSIASRPDIVDQVARQITERLDHELARTMLGPPMTPGPTLASMRRLKTDIQTGQRLKGHVTGSETVGSPRWEVWRA